MKKYIISQVLIFSLIILPVFFLMPTVSRAQTSTLASEQAYKLIKEAESSMSLIDVKLVEIQQLGSLPINSGIVMQVSLGEISGKLEVSKDLLDRAVSAYQAEDYTTAAILAFRSKQNSILTTLYLEGLMNKASADLGVSRLELQGTFADLLRLRGLLQPVTTTVEPEPTDGDNDDSNQNTDTGSTGDGNGTGNSGGGNESTTDTGGDNDNNASTTNNNSTDTTNQNSQATSTTSTTTTDSLPPVVTVPEDPKVIACIDKNIVACKTQESTCITKVKNIVNTCQTKFEAGAGTCKRYEVRSNTYLAKCQSNLSTCLAGNIAAKNIRCQTRFSLCQISAKISQDRDLNTAKTCLAKQVTKKEACDKTFSTRTNTLLTRCTSTYNTCDNKVKAKCIASVAPKVKAVAKPKK